MRPRIEPSTPERQTALLNRKVFNGPVTRMLVPSTSPSIPKTNWLTCQLKPA
jgi:hypothetical protein